RPGILLELLHLMAKAIGASVRVAEMPWNRAVQTIGEDKVKGVIFPLIRAPNREPHYTWIVRALNDRKVFFCRADRRIADGSGEESSSSLRKARIGVIRGSPFEKQLQRLDYPLLDPADDAA